MATIEINCSFQRFMPIFILFTGFWAQANISHDIQLIRQLAPPNHDLAQVQAAILQGVSAQEALIGVSKNYLYQDLNRDQIKDLMVIYEQNPTLLNSQTNQPCEKITDSLDCQLVYGPRLLNIYLGTETGKFKEVLSKKDYVLIPDFGGGIGSMGDPLIGLSISPKLAIAIEFAAGEPQSHWSHKDIIQFREDDFYVIGQESIDSQSIEGQTQSIVVSENFITGERIETLTNSNSQPHTKKSKIAKKPLIKFSEYLTTAERR